LLERARVVNLDARGCFRYDVTDMLKGPPAFEPKVHAR
jgi:hypothetical protein